MLTCDGHGFEIKFAQSKLSLLLIKLYRAKFIRPSPEIIAQTNCVVFNLQPLVKLGFATQKN